MAIEKVALDNLEYHFDGRCALMYMTREEIAASGVNMSDLEDLTGLPRKIEGVQVGVTLRQLPGASYKISVRTVKGVDACAIAKRLGGGGHAAASGATVEGDIQRTKEVLMAAIRQVQGRPA